MFLYHNLPRFSLWCIQPRCSAETSGIRYSTLKKLQCSEIFSKKSFTKLRSCQLLLQARANPNTCGRAGSGGDGVAPLAIAVAAAHTVARHVDLQFFVAFSWSWCPQQGPWTRSKVRGFHRKVKQDYTRVLADWFFLLPGFSGRIAGR